MIWVELDGGVCYELGDDSFLLLQGRGRGDALETARRLDKTSCAVPRRHDLSGLPQAPHFCAKLAQVRVVSDQEDCSDSRNYRLPTTRQPVGVEILLKGRTRGKRQTMRTCHQILLRKRNEKDCGEFKSGKDEGCAGGR